MRRNISIIRGVLLASLALLLVAVPGGTAFADSTDTCTPPPPTQNGVRWPTGSDAGTFTYQCDGSYAGKWTNGYYLYDPVTNTRSALYNPNYTYDCNAKQWYMTSWDYSAAKGMYVQNSVVTSAPGGIPTNCPLPAPAASTETGSNNAGNAAASGSSPANAPTSTESSISTPGGQASSNSNGSIDTGINNSTGATMNNGVISFANSGNAGVTSNTTGGSATTGDAQVIANIINMLQSSSNILDIPNLVTFTADINGDVNGDLLLDPTKLSSIQPANEATALDADLTVNNSTDTAINNDVTLGANSGDATVARNTSAGDATTGTANAVANIVNVLNSAITAGQSFLGVININGNLNGDILLPPNFVDTLLASNVPRYTINNADINTTATITNNTNQSINNIVQAAAGTGNATVSNNTSAGNASTGAANTNLTIFNLTGSNVVASNDLLVFVNVLGTWYGLIMNAPAGTTAASLGGGVSSNTINSDATLTNTTDQSITNNVRVASKSGDATVSDNTSGGNATSGNATASVNLMNMINNSISLNGWFGLLFINVFGTWNGSFGINTSAGDYTAEAAPGQSTASGTPTGTTQLRIFRFIPTASARTSQNTTPGNDTAVATAGQTPTTASPGGVVLASRTIHNPLTGKLTLPDAGTIRPTAAIVAIGTGIALLLLAIGERQRFLRILHRD